jgi:hypothetical protein
MPTVNFYLNEKHKFPDEDLKKVDSKCKGQTLTIKLAEKDMEGDKIKSTVNFKNEFMTWIKSKASPSGVGVKLLETEAKIDGKIAAPGNYEFFLTFNRQRMKASLEVTAPKVAPKKEVKISYVCSSKAKGMCDDMVVKKLTSIALVGPSETGHGPVEFLSGALHAHVTNTIGVAWKWKGDEVQVVAVGKKNNQNKAQQRGGSGKALKTCEYDWTE